MRDAQSELEAQGARILIIGNGEPFHAKGFAEKHDLLDRVFTDPERSLYRALGMVRGVKSTFSASGLSAGLRAFKGGHRQTRTKGDPWQQGGTLVVSKSGDVRYFYVSQSAGDHAPVPEILAAVRED